MMSELMRRSSGEELTVSLDAKESMTNWKFGLLWASAWYSLACVPKIWADEMDIFPSNRGKMSTVADRRLAVSMSYPLWSRISTWSSVRRLKNPMSTRLMLTSVPNWRAKNRDAWRPIDSCTAGMLTIIINKRYKPIMTHIVMLNMCFSIFKTDKSR